MTITRRLLAIALLAAPSVGQEDPDSVLLLTEGDPVAGVGAAVRMNNIAVAVGGSTLLEVDTDNPFSATDEVVLQDGALLWREDQLMPAPPGATLDGFDALNLDADGDSALNVFLSDVLSPVNQALYWNTSLLLQKGDTTTAAAFSPGTTWENLVHCYMDGDDDILVMGLFDDPAPPVGLDRALVRIDTDGAGNVLGETVVVRKGDVLPGQTEAVDGLEQGPHAAHMNAAGEVIYIAQMNIAGRAVYLDDTLLAQEGDPSPVPGIDWSSFSNGEVGLNDAGDWVIHGLLNASGLANDLIVKNGVPVVRDGDALPGTDGFVITSMGSGAVQIGDTGNVLWYGDWNDPDTDVDSGLFLNDFLLVQEGVTTLGGTVIDQLSSAVEDYTMSADGHWVAYTGSFAGGVEFAAKVYIGPWTFLGQGLAGLGGVTPQLRGRGSVEGGSTVTLELTDGRPLSTTNLVIGLTELGAPFRGGTMVPDVDILAPGLPLDAAGALSVSFPFPAGVPAGVPLWYQHWIVDPAAPVGFSASNAVKSTTP